MNAPRIALPQDTIFQQLRASTPATSAWVSANAGSGKTHVLAQRVIRLLLAGIAPSRILCLTFTKAAAANMSIRVFKDLASWTSLQDGDLAGAIAETGAPAAGDADLNLARRLFARTVETPGGLKIQTIHAFCERLLQLFPFEANVPARFEVLDEARAADLLMRARESTLAEAMANEESDLAAAVALLARETASETFDKLIAEALGHREAVQAAMRSAKTPEGFARSLGKVLGLPYGTTVEAIERTIVDGGLPPAEWPDIARRLGADGGSSTKAGNRLAAAALAQPSSRCNAYLDVFLTQKLAPRADTYLPVALRTSDPALCQALDRERDRVAELAARRKAAQTVERTSALIAIAGSILDHYERLKRRRGLLDFEDLVERTRTLLKRSDAAWVLYKLDSGIDHILVDEAQDTSPAQWEILQAISADFFAGEGQSRAVRTFFAVGDEKQSIYSFQGARPDMFSAMKDHFRRCASAAERPLEDVRLLLSFRSAKAILQAVDRVFAHPPNARGLTSGTDSPEPHEALKQMPGLVEVWPAVMAIPPEEPRDWRLPVDVVDRNEPPVVLARRIADAIARWTAAGSGETVEDNGTRARRPVRPGDVMILVRSRNAFFEAMIRALKQRGVAVAGADRLSLTEHIAVMDLIAAGRAALGPDGDFTLACVLKSPLIGLDDEDLMALAPRRKGTLLQALGGSNEASHRSAAAKLASWRKRAAWLTPFGFYTQILGSDGGRRDLLARLGPEAGDAIDEFVALTLAHERDGAPSLLAFLARLDGTDLSIKRDMEAAGDAVRVMTVHAAKGLEAKIVILPDTCGVPNGRQDPKLFRLGPQAAGEPEPILWSPRVDADAGPVATAREEVRRRAVEEHNRLLYVAMTRAEERLYLAGYCADKEPPEGCWYSMIEAARLDLEPAPAFWDASETVLRLCNPGPPASQPQDAQPAPACAPALPDWLTRPPPSEAEPAEPPIRPSNPLGAADQFAPVAWTFANRGRPGVRDGLAAGRLMHKLLQHLPDVEPSRRHQMARRFLDSQGAALAPEQRAVLAEQAIAVVADPVLEPLFGPESRAEVAVAAQVQLDAEHSIEVAGQIDRIGIAADAVYIADYKTGRPAAEPTPKHLLQLALYRAAVAPLYPDKPVRAFLVWTSGPNAVEIEGKKLEAALATLTMLKPNAAPAEMPDRVEGQPSLS